MTLHPVLVAGRSRLAQSRAAFGAENPSLGEKLPGETADRAYKSARNAGSAAISGAHGGAEAGASGLLRPGSILGRARLPEDPRRL